MKIIFVFQFTISFLAHGIPENYTNPQKSGIELTIGNIRNKTGLIRIGVFRSEEGYPDRPSFNYSLAKDTISEGRLRVFVPLESSGLVAFTILDDENSNGKMDYIFGIMPKEGFGFSNNPAVTSRKAPPFSTTLFNFTGGIKKSGITMKYI